jgi:hypothetical protein
MLSYNGWVEENGAREKLILSRVIKMINPISHLLLNIHFTGEKRR